MIYFKRIVLIVVLISIYFMLIREYIEIRKDVIVKNKNGFLLKEYIVY